VSQILTLYTTPVIYLLLDRLHRRLGGKGAPVRGGETGRRSRAGAGQSRKLRSPDERSDIRGGATHGPVST
jgi:hypothetical protein